ASRQPRRPGSRSSARPRRAIPPTPSDLLQVNGEVGERDVVRPEQLDDRARPRSERGQVGGELTNPHAVLLAVVLQLLDARSALADLRVVDPLVLGAHLAQLLDIRAPLVYQRLPLRPFLAGTLYFCQRLLPFYLALLGPALSLRSYPRSSDRPDRGDQGDQNGVHGLSR